MNGRLPTLKARDLIRVLKKLGFNEVRQKVKYSEVRLPNIEALESKFK